MADSLSAIRKRPSRRTFLQVGSSALLGLGLADLLQAESQLPLHGPRAKSMIFVWLGGGPSTIDMWDPKPDAASEIRGEFATISTSIPGIAFADPMRRTAEVLDRCVLLRSLRHNIPDHVPGAQYLMTGNKPSAALEHPSLGSLAARLLPGSAGMPPYFTIGEAASSGAGFLGAAYDPFRISAAAVVANDLNGVVLPERMSLKQLEERRRFRDLFDANFVRTHADADLVPTLTKFQSDAYEILASNRIGRAFDVQTEPESIRQQYGERGPGRNLLIARRLVEAGARIVTVGTDGWDTHTGNFTTLRRLLPPLDQALASLIQDLERRGMLQDTLVVCGGEFGRTPQINAAAGRDHWSSAMAYLLCGGGLKSGCVYGATDVRGFEPLDAACSPDDLGATILTLLGFPAKHRVQTTAGRPVELFQHGAVISDLIA